jgi:hypothetical protein
MSITAKLTDSKMRKMRRTIIVLVFAASVAFPIPFLSNMLTNEEGFMGNFGVDNGINSSPPMLTMQCLNDVDSCTTYANPHPITPFLLMSGIYQPVTSLFLKFAGRDFNDLGFTSKTLLARVPPYLIYVLGFFFLLYSNRWIFKIESFWHTFLPLSVLLFGTSSLLLVAGAIRINFDGNTGILLVGLFSSCIFGASTVKSDTSRNILVFSGGFFAALGKNEWALGLLLAIIGISVLLGGLFIFTRCFSGEEKRIVRVDICIMLAGLTLGSIISYYLCKSCYTGGWEVMERVGSNWNPVTGVYLFWERRFWLLLRWLWPLYLVTCFSLVLLIFRLRKLGLDKCDLHFELILHLWGIGILVGYTIPSWMGAGQPRYLCPAFFAMLFVIFKYSKNTTINPIFLRISSVYFVIGMIIHLNVLSDWHSRNVDIGELPGSSLIEMQERYEKKAKDYEKNGLPVIEQSPFSYYYPTIQFISESHGEKSDLARLELWKKRMKYDDPQMRKTGNNE